MQSRVMNRIWVLTVIMGLFAPSLAFAGDTTKVTVMGVAGIVGGDKGRARDKAIQDAQRKAVEQAVGTMVSSETITENFQLISDKIYSNAKGYVRKYDIVSEKEEGGTVMVTIDAHVASGVLQGDIDGVLAILKAKNMPRVLLMITEQNVGSANTVVWWSGEGSFSIDLGASENAFIDNWSKKGIKFIDRQALQGKLKVKKALGNAVPTDDDVKEFALGTGAEVVVTGTAFANDIGPIMGTQMHSIRANISVRALNLDTGGILATSTNTATVGHIDPATGGTKALQNVTEKAAEELLTKILAGWETEVAGPSSVSLTINAVTKSKYLREISSFLGNEIRGVQGVRQRSYRKKIAEFEVDITGSPQDLAEELEEKKFGGFTIEINEITANTVKATLNTK